MAGRRIDAVADVLLYLGPRGCLRKTIPTADEAADARWGEELNRRFLIQFGKPFQPDSSMETELHPGVPCQRR
jgi:hypothetical protein